MNRLRRKRTRNDHDTSIPTDAKELTALRQMPLLLENISQRDLESAGYNSKLKSKKREEFDLVKIKTESKEVISPIEVIPFDFKAPLSKDSEHNQVINQNEEYWLPNIHTGAEKLLWSIPSPVRKIRLNLPNLLIPQRLSDSEEITIRDLRIFLWNNGFDVSDRPTLVFFAIGKQLDVQKAGKCFIDIYNLFLNTGELTSPDRLRLEHMEVDGFIEGFARHYDGSFGWLLNARKWNFGHHDANYVFRALLCYIFKMVDLRVLKRGITIVVNCRNLTWKSFAPFEVAKCIVNVDVCLPLKLQNRFLIDLGRYGRVAHRVLSPLLPANVRKSTVILPKDLVRERYPGVVLPPSLTGLKCGNRVKQLSVRQQLDFNFFLE